MNNSTRIVRAQWLLVLFVTGFCTSGCATLARSVETPDVSLTSLRLVEAGLTKQRYDLTLNVQNPNAIPLPVRGLAYRVRLAGEDFAAGETLQSFTIPANGSTDFELAITTDLVRTLSGLQRMIEQREETLQYELGGQLQVNLPFVKAIPFSKAGNIDLAGAYRY